MYVKSARCLFDVSQWKVANIKENRTKDGSIKCMFVIHAFQWHVAWTLQCRQSENFCQKYLSHHLIPTIYIWPFSSLVGEIVFCSYGCLFDVILLMSWAQWYFVLSCYACSFPSFFSFNLFFNISFCVLVCV